MINEIVSELLQNELQKLEEEIKLVPDDALWKSSGAIKNSCGNLCLHLCGNLQHYVGAELGKSGYVRTRDAEFSSRDIPKEKLLGEIKKTKEIVSKTLSPFKKEDLDKIYPQNFIGKEVTTEYFLVHLLTHFDYHLGQINYLRRMM